jgi:succinate dehydrogenase / fumarate reductase cytochrome b subunit
LLWIARISLIVMAILHIIAAAQLTIRNRASRPVDYAKQEHQASTFASRYMRIGGAFLLFFIIIHLGHFTTGWFNPSMVHLQPYGNVVVLFERSPFWVAFYVTAMTVLGLHLYHGIWAGFRTLGVTKPDPMPLERKLSLGVAVIVWAGFIAVPIAVMLGILD